MIIFVIQYQESTEMFNIFELHIMQVTITIRGKQIKVMNLATHHVGGDMKFEVDTLRNKEVSKLKEETIQKNIGARVFYYQSYDLCHIRHGLS